MGRQPCCEKIGLKRGPWTIEEDHKLMTFILQNGIHCWRQVLGLDPVTHKPIQHHENPEIEEKKLQVESLDNPGPKEYLVALEEQGKCDLVSNETINLLDSVMLWESLDMGLMNSKTNPSNTCSSSFSLEDSLNPSMGESSIQEDSLQHWVHSVDSILSWEGFDNLEDIFLLGKSPMKPSLSLS
ncbi:hypothetical protein HHK36_025110 [Tetracentron sinense]|uniref:Myb-like domain-containing protein n=1 Tax=Tetracentron sinense TaxID=13715 RepID=A0A835D4W4_TETSI|nr:hypothetical protein HHK36_032360 [Tetracentron sinense]KAF8390583.1 hypothetical protein HHK36_025110 [Tetracentron sinense]